MHLHARMHVCLHAWIHAHECMCMHGYVPPTNPPNATQPAGVGANNWGGFECIQISPWTSRPAHQGNPFFFWVHTGQGVSTGSTVTSETEQGNNSLADRKHNQLSVRMQRCSGNCAAAQGSSDKLAKVLGYCGNCWPDFTDKHTEAKTGTCPLLKWKLPKKSIKRCPRVILFEM